MGGRADDDEGREEEVVVVGGSVSVVDIVSSMSMPSGSGVVEREVMIVCFGLVMYACIRSNQ